MPAPVFHAGRAPHPPLRVRSNRSFGYSLIELLLTTSIAATMAGIAVPLVSAAVDEMRVSMAARYLEGRIMNARMTAVKHSTRVGLRFEPVGGDYRFGEYADGNGNGVRSADIAAGADPELAPRAFLRDLFPSVAFGLRGGIPDLDGTRSTAESDGIRIGVSRILTLGPDGTATSGTMYVKGRRGQYAVRVLGATGRTRVLFFNPGTQRWISR